MSSKLTGFLVFFTKDFKAADKEESLKSFFTQHGQKVKDREFPLLYPEDDTDGRPLSMLGARDLLKRREDFMTMIEEDPLALYRHTTMERKDFLPQFPNDKRDIYVVFAGDSTWGDNPESEVWEFLQQVYSYNLQTLFEFM